MFLGAVLLGPCMAQACWPIVRVVLVVAVVSLLVNVTTVHPLPAASFYSPASRFWELMVGGILACMRLKPPTPSAGAAICSRCWASD